MSAVRQLLMRVRAQGRRRATVVRTVAMGAPRVFEAFDLGGDTFILERGIAGRLGERPSALVVAKNALRRHARGHVMTLTTGNHSVAAFPLLDGRFWSLSALPAARRGETLQREIVCGNVVDGILELSQREVPTDTFVACDGWIVSLGGMSLRDVSMVERNEETLAHYRRLGQDWRVKPLAWTEAGMKCALTAARRRIASRLNYYHSAQGVHLLSFREFARFSELARTDSAAFLAGLTELVGVYEGQHCSFTRQVKHRGHHEIEFFGLQRGAALERLIPEIERLMESVALGRLGRLGVIQRAQEIVALYRSLLARPEFADEDSPAFVNTLYMYVTGEIYAVVGEGSTPAFDDRRTALPGATFHAGRPTMHPGADSRTAVLLANLADMMSKDEIIEYANVYELRGDEGSATLGRGATREVVYKTSRRPLENSLIEKRLSCTTDGYGCYVLARIGALRALGIALSDRYLLLRSRAIDAGRPRDYYIRTRCEGMSRDAIPANYFRRADGTAKGVREVLLAFATLMGDAAAQNMAMKKFDPVSKTPLYDVGKEIYRFDYDLTRGRMMPVRVATCSIRGSFGWPDVAQTDANFNALAEFYLSHYAHALVAFQGEHPDLPLDALAKAFFSGFAYRTQALAWHLGVMRDEFAAFNPPLPTRYGFVRKWAFVLWAIARQAVALDDLKRIFTREVAGVCASSPPVRLR